MSCSRPLLVLYVIGCFCFFVESTLRCDLCRSNAQIHRTTDLPGNQLRCL